MADTGRYLASLRHCCYQSSSGEKLKAVCCYSPRDSFKQINLNSVFLGKCIEIQCTTNGEVFDLFVDAVCKVQLKLLKKRNELCIFGIADLWQWVKDGSLGDSCNVPM